MQAHIIYWTRLLCLTNVKLLPKCLTEEQIGGMLSSNVVVTLDIKFLQFVLFFLFLFLHLCFWMQKTFCVHYIWHVKLSNHKTLTSLSHCCCGCCCITFFIPWCFSSFLYATPWISLRAPFPFRFSQMSPFLLYKLVYI